MRLPPEPLRSDRLRLRAPDAALDRERLIELADDYEVARRLGRLPHPYGAADADFFFDQVCRTETCWAILDDDGFVGVIGLAYEAGRAPELGYWLGRPYWGRGYATEAARAVVTATDDAGTGRLVSGYFVSNPASGRVLAKCGFEETGRSYRNSLASGEAMPHVDVARAAASERAAAAAEKAFSRTPRPASPGTA